MSVLVRDKEGVETTTVPIYQIGHFRVCLPFFSRPPSLCFCVSLPPTDPAYYQEIPQTWSISACLHILDPRCFLSHSFSQMTTVHDVCAVVGAGPEAYMFSRRLSVHLRNKASTISVPRKKWEKLSNRRKNRARVIYRGSKTRKTQERRDGHSGYVSTKVSFATKRAGIIKMSIDAFQESRDVVAGIAPVVQL